MQEVRLGNLYGATGGNYAGNVYDMNGLCPTINTCGGGGREPMVIEVGHIEKGTGKHQSNVVYSEDGLAPTICASYRVKQPAAMHCEINVLGNYMQSNHDASRVVDTNGIAPTVKENHGTVTGIVEVKQATKDGYIECEVGGDSRPKLSRQSNTQRKSARQRTDKPNTDNGEYP